MLMEIYTVTSRSLERPAKLFSMVTEITKVYYNSKFRRTMNIVSTNYNSLEFKITECEDHLG
jgi:hypothetical protein